MTFSLGLAPVHTNVLKVAAVGSGTGLGDEVGVALELQDEAAGSWLWAAHTTAFCPRPQEPEMRD